MKSHHLKHSSPINPTRELLKEKVHEAMITRLGLQPFQPAVDHTFIDAAKNGRFNQSNCAIALYSNAFSQKAMFPESSAPLGYIYKKNGETFSFGVYQRHDGKFFGSILPISSSLETIAAFSKTAITDLPISGIYVRFLRDTEFSRIMSQPFGFKPAKEEPWLPEAPEEDESLCHSRVNLSKVVSEDGENFSFAPLRRSFSRGKNFLARTRLNYRLTPLTTHNLTMAMGIIKSHFDMIEAKNKLVGSCYSDYYGLLQPDVISLKSVTAYLGFLGNLPISVFICESNGPGSMAGYAGITLRNVDYFSLEMDLPPSAIEEKTGMSYEKINEVMGVSSVPTYAFGRLFLDLYSNGCRSFLMGGSEHADIDMWKQRQMGAEKDPTYWAILSK